MITHTKRYERNPQKSSQDHAHVRREATHTTHTSFRGSGSSGGGSGLGFRNCIFRTRYIARTGDKSWDKARGAVRGISYSCSYSQRGAGDMP